MKKQLLNLKTIVVAVGILFSGAANAFTAVTSGNWSSAATWGGVAPGSTILNADIIIPAGITVTLDQNVTFTGLLNQFSVIGALSSTSMNNVTINSGVFTGSGMVSIRKITFANVATAAYTGSMTVNEFMNSASSLAFVATLNVMDSLHLDNGTLNVNNNGTLAIMNNATIKVRDGVLALGGTGVFNSSANYNLMYAGATKTTGVEFNGNTVQNLFIKMNNNTQEVAIAANTTVNSNLDVMMGRLNLNGKQLTLKGNVNMAAGTSVSSNVISGLVVEGSGPLTSGIAFTSGASIDAITNNRAGSNLRLTSNVTVVGDLYLMNGTTTIDGSVFFRVWEEEG